MDLLTGNQPFTVSLEIKRGIADDDEDDIFVSQMWIDHGNAADSGRAATCCQTGALVS